MNYRRGLSLALVCGMALGFWRAAEQPAAASEDMRNGSSGWSRSVVTVEVARKQYDYFQPWSKPMRQALKTGVVIAGKRILTTADELFDRTLVRLQKNGRGRWWTAKVTWIDYHANLALLTTDEADFWSDLKPVTLGRTTPSDGKLQILRWRDGNIESRAAEFTQYTVRESQLAPINHAVLEASSEIQGAGHGEPMIANSKLVGLVRSHQGRTCVVIPVSFIQSILEARDKGEYRGLGYFHFVWQRAENPASLEYLMLPGKPRGAIVIEVPARPDGAEQVFKPRDIILQIDGHAIDTDGDYMDPEFGNLMLENLSTRRKWAGDTLKFQIWRDGHAMDITYRLPKYEYTNSLVPFATYDQEPQYLIAGGLVFQPLTDSYLQVWGPDWKQKAPFRLNYYNNEQPSKERPALVVLSQVLPDDYNIGYQEERGLVLSKVNGRPVHYLSDLSEALRNPEGDYHLIEFVTGDGLQRMVLAAGDAESAATKRVLGRYGIPASSRLQGTAAR